MSDNLLVSDQFLLFNNSYDRLHLPIIRYPKCEPNDFAKSNQLNN